MRRVRLGAVEYLNARPLVFGLEQSPRFTIRYDLPSECARLLQAGDIDLGLVPSIEYLRDDAYRAVPGLAITSCGPVTSVALYTRRPIADVRSIVMDTSSRTSVALVRVLCARLFKIQPVIEAQQPDLETMLSRADAALVIGDPALFADHQALGAAKTDLGEEWTSMTGLPFVWAFWAGRPGVLSGTALRALATARDAGVADSDAIADAYCGSERSELCRGYLRDNIKYVLDDRAADGLRRYYDLAARHGVIESPRPMAFY